MREAAAALDQAFRTLDVVGRLGRLVERVPGRLVLTTSFGLEDQVLTHFIAEAGLPVAFATLDTGRLFPETYDVWAATETRYGITIAPYFPAGDALVGLLARQGVNGFHQSVEARRACCDTRKVEPLSRALAGAAGWIAGLRADQSQARGETPFVEHDARRNLIKANPLLDWTRPQAAAFAARHHVPVSALHARGFLSIGCAPCTRAVAPGESERAGRWWWEDDAKKECGLHVGPDGRLQRSAAPEARP